MPEKPFEDVRIQGHLIDSLLVPQVMDDVMDLEGEFEMLTFDVGRTKTDPSVAVMRVYGRDREHLEEILTRDPAARRRGRRRRRTRSSRRRPADGVFPDEFYSTTNMETYVRLDGDWVRVAQPEMDCGIRVDSGGAHGRDGRR